MPSTMADPITKKMEEGIARGAFPGGVLLIFYKGEVCFHKAFGLAQLLPNKTALTRNTFFDLSSLTKPLATTFAAARLMEKEILHGNDPVSKWIPAFKKGEKRKATLWHLLGHTSGLPAWKPYYKAIAQYDEKERGFLGSLDAKQKIYQWANHEPLFSSPGQESRYSDIGFMIIGEIIESVAGKELDQLCEALFPPPSGTNCFFPGMRRNKRGSYAATEDCSFRQRILRGEVHDENAYAMGGVSGHAGLFGTAKGVYLLTQCWLDSLKGEGVLHPALASRFVTGEPGQKGSFAAGWDTPSNHSSSGRFFSKSSFGHLGFTGTSIWADRARDLGVILLTNRVHPRRDNEGIKQFRPELHDLIVQEVVGD